MSDEFLAVMLLIQSVTLGVVVLQLQLLTSVFRELVEKIDKWDEVMSARTWIFKQVKSNEQQRGNALRYLTENRTLTTRAEEQPFEASSLASTDQATNGSLRCGRGFNLAGSMR